MLVIPYSEFFEGGFFTKSKFQIFEGKIFTNHPKEHLEIAIVIEIKLVIALES